MKIYCLLGLLSFQYAIAQPVKLLSGKYLPGFISITRFDTSRAAIAGQTIKDKGRLLQVNIWYPSTGVNKQRPMDFGQYVQLAAYELDSSAADVVREKQAVADYFAWPASLGADTNAYLRFIQSAIPMRAQRNADWKKGKFSLVMLVNGSAADHAYLAEYLAGYGYIVLQVPVKGSLEKELDYETGGLEAQVLDYEFAMQVLQKEYPFLNGQVAVAGFSFGGQSSVALALRNKQIKSVVSLDGGTGSWFGAQLISRQPYYRLLDTQQPILHVYNPNDPDTNLHWFSQQTGTHRYLASMKQMQHGHFTSFGLLNKKIPGIMGEKAADPGDGYEAVMALTKAFIDKQFKPARGTVDNFFRDQLDRYAWMKNCIVRSEIKKAGA